jgi:class 3 adenylate cyclase
MQFVEKYWEQLKALFAYARYCADNDRQTVVCRDFWLWAVYGGLALGLFIAFIVIRKILAQRAEFRRNQLVLEERRYVEEEQSRAKVEAETKEQTALDLDMSQHDLAASIRQAMSQRVTEPPPKSAKERADRKAEAAPQRELAAIMLTDIVGYSGSMERDESRAYASLLEHNNIVRGAIAEHRGREIKTIGDAFLVTFRSAADAVDCALAVQRALTEYNADKEPVDKIVVRIGVHLGDILVTSNDVYGDGINVCSRIVPLAEPGGICVTESVFALVRKKLEFNLERIDGVTLKNITSAPDVYRIRMNSP